MNSKHSTSIAVLKLFFHSDRITLDDYDTYEVLYNSDLQDKGLKDKLIFAVTDFAISESLFRESEGYHNSIYDDDEKAELYTMQCQMIRFAIEIMNKLLNDYYLFTNNNDANNIQRINKALGGDEESSVFIKKISKLCKIKKENDYDSTKYIRLLRDIKAMANEVVDAINLYLILDENRQNCKSFNLKADDNFLCEKDKKIIIRLLKGDYFEYKFQSKGTDTDDYMIKPLTEKDINDFYKKLKKYGKKTNQQDKSISNAADMIFVNFAHKKNDSKEYKKEVNRVIKAIEKHPEYRKICDTDKIPMECNRKNLIYLGLLDYFFCKDGGRIERFNNLISQHDQDKFYEEIADLIINISKLLDRFGYPTFTLRADTDIRLFSRIICLDNCFDEKLIKDFYIDETDEENINDEKNKPNKKFKGERDDIRRSTKVDTEDGIQLGFNYGNELYFIPWYAKYEKGLVKEDGKDFYSILSENNIGDEILKEYFIKYKDLKAKKIKLQKIKILSSVSIDRKFIKIANKQYPITYSDEKMDTLATYKTENGKLIAEVAYFNIYLDHLKGRERQLFVDADTNILSFIKRENTRINSFVKRFKNEKNKGTLELLNNNRLNGQAAYILFDKKDMDLLKKLIDDKK